MHGLCRPRKPLNKFGGVDKNFALGLREKKRGEQLRSPPELLFF
jgi:hypothetical protein